MPRQLILGLSILLPLSLGFATMRAWAPRESAPVRIATWNLEWLLSQRSAHAARLACRAGRRPAIPCDVAIGHARDSADLARLAAHARRTGADVIAFQEVENADIAQRIFPGHDICITQGRGVQQVGFAVRPGTAHRCEGPLYSLALGGTQRAGMLMTLRPGTRDAVLLLAVHLKSGCADAPLDSPAPACATLRRQAEALRDWLREQRARGARVMVLGDFNRGDEDIARDAFWNLLRDENPPAPAWLLAGAGIAYRNCVMGAPYLRGIDHILLSGNLASAVVAGSFQRFPFGNPDAVRYRLSDHCPVRISLNLSQSDESALH